MLIGGGFSIFVLEFFKVYNLNLAIVVDEIQDAHMLFMMGGFNLVADSLLRVNYLLIIFDIITFQVLLLDFVDFIIVEIREQITVLLVCAMPENLSRLEHFDLSFDLLFIIIWTIITVGYVGVRNWCFFSQAAP